MALKRIRKELMDLGKDPPSNSNSKIKNYSKYQTISPNLFGSKLITMECYRLENIARHTSLIKMGHTNHSNKLPLWKFDRASRQMSRMKKGRQ